MKISNIIILFAILLSFTSCKDSYGVDSRVVKIETNKDSNKGTGCIVIKDIGLSFYEYFIFPSHSSDYQYCIAELEWRNLSRILFKDILLDTTGSKLTLNIRSLQIKSIMPDTLYYMFSDTALNKTVFFEMKINSLPLVLNNIDTLMGSPDSGDFCLLRLKSRCDDSACDYISKDITFSYKVTDVNIEEKFASIYFAATMPEEFNKLYKLTMEMIVYF